MLTDELATMGLPLTVRMLHCENVKVKIPWFSWSTNPVEVSVDGLLVVLEPTNESQWTVEQVRSSKERAIEDALVELLRRQATAATAATKKKPSERRPRAALAPAQHGRVNAARGGPTVVAVVCAPAASAREWAELSHACAVDAPQVSVDNLHIRSAPRARPSRACALSPLAPARPFLCTQPSAARGRCRPLPLPPAAAAALRRRAPTLASPAAGAPSPRSYEQFDTLGEQVGQTVPFSLGLMLTSCVVETTVSPHGEASLNKVRATPQPQPWPSPKA
eukprot:3817187-Prymnesium_polylepis.1